MTNDYSEARRKILHIGMVGFALLLRVLTWQQAALCAVATFLFNAVLLPRLGGATLNRPAIAEPIRAAASNRRRSPAWLRGTRRATCRACP